MSTVNPGTIVTLQSAIPSDWSLADLQQRLGGIPIERIRLFPPPGCATVQDVERIYAEDGRRYELEDGILVEKAMGWYESLLASIILVRMSNHVSERSLGKVLGADALLKILPGIVRLPDVSFFSWSRWPNPMPQRRPIPMIMPDLVVEVLSESNTLAEMNAKLTRYFEANVRLVWYIDPSTRTATTHTSPIDSTPISTEGTLDGLDVLPGFELSLQKLFEEADRQGP